MKPENLLFAKTHEWVAVTSEDGQKSATLGISAFAVEALTDLVFIELPKLGRQVKAGESFCEVESVKAVSDVYAPMSGEVTEVNSAAAESPEQINQDPYGDGWLIRVKLSDSSEADGLMDAAAYRKMLEDEDADA